MIKAWWLLVITTNNGKEFLAQGTGDKMGPPELNWIKQELMAEFILASVHNLRKMTMTNDSGKWQMTVTVTITNWQRVPRMSPPQIDERVLKRGPKAASCQNNIVHINQKILLRIYSCPPGELIQFIPKNMMCAESLDHWFSIC